MSAGYNYNYDTIQLLQLVMITSSDYNHSYNYNPIAEGWMLAYIRRMLSGYGNN